MGRSLWDLLTVYFSQAGQYSMLAMFLPNLYTWLGDSTAAEISRAGVMLAGGVVLCAVFFLYRRGFPLSPANLVSTGLFFALLTPFLLPHMHERYFYPADLLAVLFAVCLPREQRVPLLVPLCSAALAVRFLCGAVWISPGALALPMLAAALFCAGALRRGAGEK